MFYYDMAFYRKLVLYLLFIFLAGNTSAQKILNDRGNNFHNVSFVNVDDPEIIQYFLDVYRKFDNTDFKITLIQKEFKSSTMRAQPKLGSILSFRKSKHYKIAINPYVNSTDLHVSALPVKVIKGWFAHEMGHLMDYHTRTNAGMVLFGIKYVFSNDFKRNAEFTADSIAVSFGFSDEIIAMKKFLLQSKFIHDNYKSNISKYYMSLPEVENLPKNTDSDKIENF